MYVTNYEDSLGNRAVFYQEGWRESNLGRLFGYILLSLILGFLLLWLHPSVALFIGLCVIAGTLFYIAYLLKKEQPRIIEDRLKKHFSHVQKVILDGQSEIDKTSLEKETGTADL